MIIIDNNISILASVNIVSFEQIHLHSVDTNTHPPPPPPPLPALPRAECVYVYVHEDKTSHGIQQCFHYQHQADNTNDDDGPKMLNLANGFSIGKS